MLIHLDVSHVVAFESFRIFGYCEYIFKVFAVEKGCGTDVCVSAHPVLERRVYEEEEKQPVGCTFQTIAQIPHCCKYIEFSQILMSRSSQEVSHKAGNLFSKCSE